MFSQRLKQLREEKGITQLELANILGITPQNISYYEKGREPNYEILSKLADYFGVTTDYLIGKSDFRTWEEENFFTEALKTEIINSTYPDFKNILTPLIHNLLKFQDIKYQYFSNAFEEILENLNKYIEQLFTKKETILKTLNVKNPSTISSVSLLGISKDRLEIYQSLYKDFTSDENLKIYKSEIITLIEHIQFIFVKYTFDIIQSFLDEQN